MSNKAEVAINGVHIYTHLGGSEVKRRVADALVRSQDRNDQPDYVTRAIVDEMEKDATGEITGVGISAAPYDVLPRVEVHGGLNKVVVIDYDGCEVYDTRKEFKDEYRSEESHD